jgi:hypothetical protein
MDPMDDAEDMWLAEADTIVREWETAVGTRLLLTLEAAELVRLIAKGLQSAFERGKRYCASS